MKKVCFVTLLVLALAPLFGQSGSTTVNNTITINGNVYYFKPSTSPSSALPQVKNDSNWIGDGTWWGEDAAKAWASIVDWTVLHCYRKGGDYSPGGPYVYYINRITAKKDSGNRGVITIYFWYVKKGQKMEEGGPENQVWYVEF